MALLIILPQRSCTDLVRGIQKVDPTIDVRVWPDTGERADIDFAVVWNHPAGELSRYPNLKAICSYGAGVDHLLRDPRLPSEIPILRIVDDNLACQMTEFLVAVVLHQKRRLAKYLDHQKHQLWKRYAVSEIAGLNRLAILGLGHIGRQVAAAFCHLGFEVHGWSRSPKRVSGIHCFHGSDQLDRFLPKIDFLICLLPLTILTKNILDRKLFSKLKRGAYVINVGRGDHLVEDDLLAAVDEGQLSGAWLDVFRQEPLTASHPFWLHRKIQITPHIASLTDPDSVAPQICDNYRRATQGLALLYQIDRRRGY